jgi:hypothetical protein
VRGCGNDTSLGDRDWHVAAPRNDALKRIAQFAYKFIDQKVNQTGIVIIRMQEMLEQSIKRMTRFSMTFNAHF